MAPGKPSVSSRHLTPRHPQAASCPAVLDYTVSHEATDHTQNQERNWSQHCGIHCSVLRAWFRRLHCLRGQVGLCCITAVLRLQLQSEEIGLLLCTFLREHKALSIQKGNQVETRRVEKALGIELFFVTSSLLVRQWIRHAVPRFRTKPVPCEPRD